MYSKHFAKYLLLCLIAELVLYLFLWPTIPNVGIIFGIPKANFFIPTLLIKLIPYIFLFTIIFFNQAKEAPHHPFLTGLAILLFTETIGSLVTGFSIFKVVLLVFVYLTVTSLTLFFKKRKQNNAYQPTSPYYFPISTLKLFFMHFTTLGLYNYYWWYQNWRYIKLRDNNKTYPFFRCIFPIFFYENFLEKINYSNRTHKVPGIKHTELLTDYYIFIVVGFIAISVLAGIYNSLTLNASRYIITNMLSTIYLILSIAIYLPPQLAINRLNRSANINLNKKFSNCDAILIVLGVFMWLSVTTYWTLTYRSDTRNAEILYDHGFYALAYKKALSAAEDGDAKGQYLLGQILLLGKGMEQDTKQGVDWLEQSGNQGNTDAQYLLGLLYHDGAESIAKDDNASATWYKKAVASGHVYAMNNLGVLYDHGWGVEKNPGKAMALFKRAAAKGDSSAMYNIGLFYSKSTSLHDLTLAANWFKKSIKTEPNPCALNDLAILYARGKGVEQNFKKSKKLFKDAGARVLLENGAEILTATSFTKAKFDEYIDAFVQYQLNKTLKSNSQTNKKYPPETKETATKISQKLVSMCWE